MPALGGSKNETGLSRVVQAGVLAAAPVVDPREGFGFPILVALRPGLSPELYSHSMRKTSS